MVQATVQNGPPERDCTSCSRKLAGLSCLGVRGMRKKHSRKMITARQTTVQIVQHNARRHVPQQL